MGKFHRFRNVNYNNKADTNHSHVALAIPGTSHTLTCTYDSSYAVLHVCVDTTEFLEIPYRDRRQAFTSDGSVWGAANIGGSYLELSTLSGSKGITYSFSSDERIKKNIESVEDISALDYLKRIKYYSYDWKDPEVAKFKGHTKLGYIAQNLREINNEFTFEVDQSNCPEAEYDYILNIDDQKLLPYITKAIVELADKIESL